MKTNPFYKYNKNRNMDPKEKENINEEELMSEATQDEAAENEEIQELTMMMKCYVWVHIRSI